MGWTGDSAGNFTVCWCLMSHRDAAQHSYRRRVFVEEIGKKFQFLRKEIEVIHMCASSCDVNRSVLT